LDKHLHIVTHDVPWPADYGGVVDLFYKIVSLHALGCKIHLHCFTSGSSEQIELNKYCETVHYYKRKKFSAFSLTVPYIVQSRSDKDLINRLQKDNHPVLLEGIHCTYFLNAGVLSGRKVFIRLHNVEFEYYHSLAKHEKNIFRKIYFRIESKLLKKYESGIANKAPIWTVSTHDTELYKKEFNAKDIQFVPVFLPWQKVNPQSGKGYFCLYHGNLSINENEKAVRWLMKEVFNTLNIPFVIAGKDPGHSLQLQAHHNPGTCLIANPSEYEMQDLISKAQINILPSFNNTGVKLKLLNALFNGRHCIVNDAAIEGAGVKDLCAVASAPAEFKKLVQELFDESFTEQQAIKRQETLQVYYDNEKNARQIMSWI